MPRIKCAPPKPGSIDKTLKRILEMERSVPAAEIYLQVVGNGSKGSSKSLYVFVDQWRYLFNCGEGTQRLSHEYKIKLSKLEHVFITHASWDNFGGLPGLILTLQDIALPKITLHGPSGIEKLFQMTSGFMLTSEIEIEKRDVEDVSYTDSIMSVKYVPIYGPTLEKAAPLAPVSMEDATTDYYDHQRTSKRESSKEEQSPVKKKLKTSQGSVTPNDRDVSVAYICRCANKPGMLQMDKCVDFGVPPGPLLGKLKNGHDVTLGNGTVVKSSDVVKPEQPGPVFIVVDCPSAEFLDSLVKNEDFACHQSGAKAPEDVAAIVVHFTPASVLSTEEYQAWMRRFDPSTEHLIINDSNAGPSSRAVHRIQHKLNLLHSTLFPLLKEPIAEEEQGPAPTDDAPALKILPGQTLLRYYLRPFKRVDSTSAVNIDVKEFHEECAKTTGFSDLLSELKSEVLTKEPSTNGSPRFPEILFLGTGSSVPSKVRNTSAILLNLSASESILMDCAEGTFVQLYRHYGADVNSVLRNLQAIFISHLHADHHLGLIKLLKQRRIAFQNSNLHYTPVELIAPQQIMPWLQLYHQTFEPILDDFTLFPNLWFQFGRGTLDHKQYRDLLTKLNLKQLEAVPVKHCRHAFGIALTHRDNFKIVYSGDTMPCESLVRVGMDCDLLIHEATMEDDLFREANMKKHSTTSDAIKQGIEMKAKFTILTHFSQRYAKVPLFMDDLGNNVGFAFDNLRVNLDNIHILPRLTAILKTLFAEEYEEMQGKTAKKLLQRSKQEAALELAVKDIQQAAS